MRWMGSPRPQGTHPRKAKRRHAAVVPPGWREHGGRFSLRRSRGFPGAGPGYLTEPAVMPATRNRCSSRKPTTIGTLTVSDAAMIWFQYTWFCVA